MQPRDIIDEADPYDEAYDFAEGSEIKPPDKLKLDIQEEGLSREQILKYSVCQRPYPSDYELIYVLQAFNRDGFNCVITGLPLQYPQRPHNGVRCSLIYRLNRHRYRPNLTPIIPFLIENVGLASLSV